MLVLDAGGVSRLAERSPRALALLTALRGQGLWPPLVPSIVLVECLTGRPERDVGTNRFLKTCDVRPELGGRFVRRAAEIRHQARRGSAVDAVVVATAEPGGTVLSGDVGDLQALAAQADAVAVELA